MLIPRRRFITQEQYNMYIATKNLKIFFSDVEIYGYGVYYIVVHKEEDRYYVTYKIGSSCD